MSTPERLAQAFADQMRDWAARVGADETTQALAGEAARRVSIALAQGHTCLPAAQHAASRQALLASGVVGTAQQPGSYPLILDDQDRLYLHRYFDYEVRLATRLHGLCAPALPAPPDAALLARVQPWLQAEQAEQTAQVAGAVASGPDWQTLGAALAVLRRFTLISGGPGTGKTSTVVRLLGCLLALNPQTRIVLAAPTGKAAARMQQAVQTRADSLPDVLRAQLPTAATTLHRLLGVDGTSARFRHHARNPLALDVLVVDEASMLDLSLATHLIEALPPEARLILLGDKDQLAAVQSGAVFAELSGSMALSPDTIDQLGMLTGTAADRMAPVRVDAPSAASLPPLCDSVVWFSRQYRFAAASPIGRLAAYVRDGNALAALALLQQPPAGLGWMAEAGWLPDAALNQAVLEGFEDFFAAVEDAASPAQVFAAFDAFRVLCALQAGPWGAQAFNQRLAAIAQARVEGPGAAALSGAGSIENWYRGRPVLVLRNDPLLALFNGDVGITLPDASGELQVCFLQPDGSLRWIPPVRLPDHETAYAMTIHKSQGSEFDAVAVILPPERSPLLTRELLYTGVTRARHRVLVQGSAAIVQAAIQTPTERSSGLLARLAAMGA